MSTTMRERAAQVSDPKHGPSPEVLRELYKTMALVRALDSEAIAMQRHGILPAYAPERGQEAAQVGSAAALDPKRDFAFPTYRELGAAIAMGVDAVGYIASHKGTWHGGLWNPAETHFAPLNAIVGAPPLHAVGWALGAKLDGTDGVALAYFGDGASSQGDIHEAMNVAGVSQLPVIFFCQNNGWAISVPTDEQVAGGSVAARAAGYGMPGMQVDGNDVAAVYTATREAVERARAGEGPTVIEAMTYRSGPHSTSDDPGRYRTLEEERSWVSRDPLTRGEALLRERGDADDAFFESVADEAKAFAHDVREAVRKLPAPAGEEMFDLVFENPPASLLAQRDAWREEANA